MLLKGGISRPFDNKNTLFSLNCKNLCLDFNKNRKNPFAQRPLLVLCLHLACTYERRRNDLPTTLERPSHTVSKALASPNSLVGRTKGLPSPCQVLAKCLPMVYLPRKCSCRGCREKDAGIFACIEHKKGDNQSYMF